jgi:hypothetical protein
MVAIRAGVGALLVAAFLPRSAAADEERSREGASVQLLGNLGLGLPGGNIGIEGELYMHPRFSLGLGMGRAIGGTQVASTARFRPLRLRVPFLGGPPRTGELSAGTGLGYSTGTYEHWTLLGGTATFESTSWMNLDAFVELRTDIGLSFRCMFGQSWPVASGECVGESDLCQELNEKPPSLPYFGVALGWSFWSRP